MEDRPTVQQLNEVMRIEHVEITTKWYDLGLQLMDINTLKVIESDHRNNASTCCRIMLEKWLEKTPSASWKQLVTALSNIDMKTAANIISNLFKSGQLILNITMCKNLH